jgi:YHS domain-containing protein
MGLFDWMRAREPENLTGEGFAKDPVCGAKVDKLAPPGGTSRHGHEVYYFSSVECKIAFDTDPHRWLGHHHH